MRAGTGLLLLALLAGAQEPASTEERFLECERQAFEASSREAYEEAIAAFERQIAVFPANPRPYYNIACCHALRGDAERAATWLRLAIAHDWRDWDYVGGDPDFDGVRASGPFQEALRALLRARREDPDPLPRLLPPGGAPSAAAARSILAASAIEERLALREEGLLEENQVRRRLFPVWDRRLATLTRYLAESGDALDADLAAHARVHTAMLFLMRAGDSADDRRLVEAAARLVLAVTNEFLRGWPGSPLLPDVLLWRAHALARLDRGQEAEALLRVVAADHPGLATGPQARIELCRLLAASERREDLRAEMAALDTAYGNDPLVAVLMRERLFEARLLARGLPEHLAEAGDGPALYVFVLSGSPACERRLAELRPYLPRARLVVACVDAERETAPWLAEHAPGALSMPGGDGLAERLGLRKVPTVLLARGAEVLAVDPADEDLARLLDEGG